MRPSGYQNVVQVHDDPLGMFCSKLSMTRWNIDGADATPNGIRLY